MNKLTSKTLIKVIRTRVFQVIVALASLLLIVLIVSDKLGSRPPFSTPTPWPPSSPAPVNDMFEIEDVRMVDCRQGAQDPCDAPALFDFEEGDRICIAWTEVDRGPWDPLSIFIYDEQGRPVFSFEEDSPPRGGITSDCRVQPVESFLDPGTYQAEFVVAYSRHDDVLSFSVSEPPPPPPAPINAMFEIEDVRMVDCWQGEGDLCDAPALFDFEEGDPICIAWTEADREPWDPLSIFIYDAQGRLVFSLEEDSPPRIGTTSDCRVQPVESFLDPGTYQTEFVIADSRHNDVLSFSVRKTIPEPENAMFEIEDVRMVDCWQGEDDPCEAPALFDFEEGDPICIAWTEVDREPWYPLSIFIYDEQGRLVFSFEEDSPPRIGTTSDCRVQPVESFLDPGIYQTEFVIADSRHNDVLSFSVSEPPPPPPAPANPMFEIEDVRMVDCWEGEGDLCDAPAIVDFDVGDQICIAWTEVDRESRHPLSIFIYDEQGQPVFSHEEDSPPKIGIASNCRVQPVRLAKPGAYQVEFVVADSKHDDVLSFSIRKPIKANTPPVWFEIESARMVSCRQGAQAPCTAPALVDFDMEDQVCIAWSEVNRRKGQPLSIFTYDDQARRVFSFEEDSPPRIGIASNCRVLPVRGITERGIYQTEFVVEGWVHDNVLSFSLGVTLENMKWSPSADYLLTRYSDDDTIVWDARTGDSILRLQTSNAEWSPDGTRIIARGRRQGPVVVWNLEAEPRSVALAGSTYSNSFMWSPNAQWLIGHSEDASERDQIWNTRTGKIVVILDKDIGTFHSLSWSSDSTRILGVNSQQDFANVWNAKTGKISVTLQQPSRTIHSATWDPTGTYILTVDDEQKAVTIWNANTGDVLANLVHNSEIISAKWSPEGSRILTTFSSNQGHFIAYVWNAETGQRVLTFGTSGEQFPDLTWSPNGTRILGWDTNRPILWSVQTATATVVLDGLEGTVQGAAWSPDGTRILGYDAQRAIIWNASTGKRVGSLDKMGDGLKYIAWSTDSSMIAGSTGRGRTVTVWKIGEDEKLLTLAPER